VCSDTMGGGRWALLSAASWVSGVSAAVQTGVACTPSSNTLKLQWNPYASEWGAYEVEGCTGVNPKLQLTAGVTYTFDQSHESNWYHPVGFSYIAGGAHAECKQDAAGTMGECPELGGEAPVTTIQYYVDGAAVTSDESGFGLDAYEPLFFNSQDWWGEKAAGFKVTLKIPVDASYTTIYWFCHIHSGMSAEIVISLSSFPASTTKINAAMLGGETEASALAIFASIQTADQPTLSTFDEACGTHASSAFDPAAASAHSTCSGKHFLCGSTEGAFEQCLEAIDCQMHHDMAVKVPSTSTSKFATFARQMIPHHQNAVAMAKVLHKHHTDADYPAAGTEDQDKAWAAGLLRNIINVQNRQIQQMKSWLDANPGKAETSANCYVEGAPDGGSSDSGLSTGALAGIIVGAVVGALLIIVAIVVILKMKKKKMVSPK